MSHTEKVQALLAAIDVKRYGKTRNYVSGSVSELGPYVSRGVISTRMVWAYLLARGHSFEEVFGFVQQLAWRDFFQRVWMGLGDGINGDIRRDQEGVKHTAVPAAIAAGTAGIEGIDVGIQRLVSSGYMHNHQRMYTAFLTCNLAGAHWKLPAQWMYAHLLDGDWGSNALSWQWVAGTFSNKKYIANQENINRYTNTQQRGTYLDVEYEQLAEAPVPEVLKPTMDAHEVLPFDGCTSEALMAAVANKGLPIWGAISRPNDHRIVICNYYQLSAQFVASQSGSPILLLEPSVFEQYPIASHCVDFMLSLAAEIPHLQVFVGEFEEFQSVLQASGSVEIIYQEHPLNLHYQGVEIPRDWLAPEVEGSFSSFFSYWKKVEKSLRKEFKDVRGY
ncbi:MAG: deoxyribodipyrimidine photolyase [Bacteroidetes bacterium]|nr:deoxyribodipyrimidine photolyase [Bacteroidota bacterium]